jgi:hypothetical protein
MTHLEEVLDSFSPFAQTTTSILQSAPGVSLEGVNGGA